MAVSAQCHRVNVADGHMAAVRVKLARKAELNEVREALESFRSLPQELGLHRRLRRRSLFAMNRIDRNQSWTAMRARE